jgi:hypothetical protein
MKKLLAVLLVGAMMAGYGVCAFATPAIGTRNVTGIEAVWNGEVILSYYLEPVFGPENVAVTLFFDEGEPELLEFWESSSDNWLSHDNWWFVSHWGHGYDTHTDRFFFYNSEMLKKEYDSLDEETRPSYYDEWLPKTMLRTPNDRTLRERYIESRQPLEKLKCGQSKAISLSTQDFKVFTFTPKRTGKYYVSFEGAKTRFDPFVRIAEPDLEEIAYPYFFSPNFDTSLQLEANKTYSLFFRSDDAEETTYKVVIRDKMQTSWQWFRYSYLSGWLMPRLKQLF